MRLHSSDMFPLFSNTSSTHRNNYRI